MSFDYGMRFLSLVILSNKDGRSALSSAAENGHTAVVDVLLEYGACVDSLRSVSGYGIELNASMSTSAY